MDVFHNMGEVDFDHKVFGWTQGGRELELEDKEDDEEDNEVKEEVKDEVGGGDEMELQVEVVKKC